MIGVAENPDKPLPVVLKPVLDELLSSWLGRHAAYYGVTGPFLANWLMLGTSKLSALIIGSACRKSPACRKSCVVTRSLFSA